MAPSRPGQRRVTFDRAYDETFPAAWRTARRLGVPTASMDDVLQEVYIVVYRRLDEFEGRSGLKAWVISILLRVVNNHRRQKRRKGAGSALHSEVAEPDSLMAEAASPVDFAIQREAARLMSELLQSLDRTQAELFIAVELEGMTVPEVAEAIDLRLGTAYSLLRSARRSFERARLRRLAREARYLPPNRVSGQR